MIDMHSHILPAVDDGAASLKESLIMLKLAIADGVRIQVLTPHLHLGRYPNTAASLQQAFVLFQQQVQTSELAIELRLAAEVRISPEIVSLVKEQGIHWLGHWQGWPVMLLEFPHHQIPHGAINLVQWLLHQGVLPMIAHPERNRELQQDKRKLVPFLQAGCLLQLTSDSLSGQFGVDAQHLSVQLLREGHVSLLATDCHNLQYRPPRLSVGYRAAAKILGEAGAKMLVETNPSRLLGESN